MKKTMLYLVIFCGLSFTTNAQVGIGTNDPDVSAMLDVESTNRGFLPPRLDNNAKLAIALPASGLIIYNTDEKCLEVNLGEPTAPEWTCFSGNSGGSGGGALATPANTTGLFASNNTGFTSSCNSQPSQVANAEPNLSTYLNDGDFGTGFGSTTRTNTNNVEITYPTDVTVSELVVGFGDIPCWGNTGRSSYLTNYKFEYFNESTSNWEVIKDDFTTTNTPNETLTTHSITPVVAKRFRLGGVGTSTWFGVSEFYLQ